MKYTKESLDLTFSIAVKYDTTSVYIWRTEEWFRGLKQMFCYTFDLDFDGELTDTDIDKVADFFGSNYFEEHDRAWLEDDTSYKRLRLDLFLAMTNSPRCPYKIIGVSSYHMNTETITIYHFMVKHDILTKSNTVSI